MSIAWGGDGYSVCAQPGPSGSEDAAKRLEVNRDDDLRNHGTGGAFPELGCGDLALEVRESAKGLAECIHTFDWPRRSKQRHARLCQPRSSKWPAPLLSPRRPRPPSPPPWP